MILDLNYRKFQKEYFGEKVSRHSASMGKKELVDNLDKYIGKKAKRALRINHVLKNSDLK